MILETFDPMIFGELDLAHMQRLRRSCRSLTVEKSQRIFEPDQECADYLLVRSGVVRVEMLSANGEGTVLYRLRSGDACVLTTATLLAKRRYSALAIAETPVEAVAIGSKAFEELLSTSPSFRRHVFADHADRILDMVAALGTVLFEPIDQRLARRLLQISKFQPTVVCTHSELANDIGTAREVVSRRLGVFSGNGWIKLARGRMEICDRAALSSISNAGRDA
jgi:CRP/FNR family transcriptional regulator